MVNNGFAVTGGPEEELSMCSYCLLLTMMGICELDAGNSVEIWTWYAVKRSSPARAGSEVKHAAALM
jgi:hypothetical protein